MSSLFVINVLDVNEAPYNLSISSQTVNENEPPGVLVSMLSVRDPDFPVRKEQLFSNCIAVNKNAFEKLLTLVRRGIISRFSMFSSSHF